jgi:hypothetical protein
MGEPEPEAAGGAKGAKGGGAAAADPLKELERRLMPLVKQGDKKVGRGAPQRVHVDSPPTADQAGCSRLL